MVRTQPHRQALTDERLVKRAAEGHAFDGRRLHSKTDDPPGALVHHHQNPMSFEVDGLNPEQIQTPQAVRGLPQQSEPGGTAAARGPVIRVANLAWRCAGTGSSPRAG